MNGDGYYRRVTWAFLALLTVALLSLTVRAAQPNVILWDTGAPLSNASNLTQTAEWTRVPTDLFALEHDPAKASSDPGYYGREYVFRGDIVIENQKIGALISPASNRILIFSKDTAHAATDPQNRLGKAIAEVLPLDSKQGSIGPCTLMRNLADEVAVDIPFGSDPTAPTALFTFGKTEIIQIKPQPGISGFSIRAPIAYGVVPGFVGDDLIFGPVDAAEGKTIFLPAENFVLALLRGENHQLVITWPKAKQHARLQLGDEKDGQRSISAVDLETAGESIFIAPLSAPGIWHLEALGPGYLEQDTASSWKPPFPARWQTQLNESGVITRFAFREGKGTVWRGVPGSYNYPVWFEGDKAYYHLSKKVSPKGESIIYFLEGQDTPMTQLTPTDVLRETLGRPAADPILDVAGRKLRTHHRRGGNGVRRACTCGCTEAIQAVFEKGEEVSKQSYITDAIDDMIFFVQCHVQRIDEYRGFADRTLSFLKQKSESSPDLKEYLEGLAQIAEQIPQEYNVQQENMKSLEYAADLARQTMALTRSKEVSNLNTYMELLKAWRGMGGAQDYVVAQCHMITRKLFQEAGYAAASNPKAVQVAQEIRERCRQILRNPDGYEIWPNY